MRVILEDRNAQLVHKALKLGTKKDVKAATVLMHLRKIKKIIEGNTIE